MDPSSTVTDPQPAWSQRMRIDGTLTPDELTGSTHMIPVSPATAVQAY